MSVELEAIANKLRSLTDWIGKPRLNNIPTEPSLYMILMAIDELNDRACGLEEESLGEDL